MRQHDELTFERHVHNDNIGILTARVVFDSNRSITVPISILEAVELGAWLIAEAQKMHAMMEAELHGWRLPGEQAAAVLQAIAPDDVPVTRHHGQAGAVYAGGGGAGGGGATGLVQPSGPIVAGVGGVGGGGGGVASK